MTVLILKILAIVAASTLAVLALAGVWAIFAESRTIKHLASKLRCPSCGYLYSREPLKNAKTSIENPGREAVEDGLRKFGVRVHPPRTWEIICTSCGKTSCYEPAGKTFRAGKSSR